ncbi:uncharacterized protein LOC115986158 [Quercus lobata]|uniref:uncharacterized protein LOC115986158 n=1 Tax=Quercus lobata TaxID=97700 RepID=UPI00124625AE|nr:uncharacterized protein LOC115986158 [Quercus lobata]
MSRMFLVAKRLGYTRILTGQPSYHFIIDFIGHFELNWLIYLVGKDWNSEEGVRENTNGFDGNDYAKCLYTRLNNISFFFHYSIPPINSIADLENEPGLFISNKEKVFAEADAMARKNREKLPSGLPLINRDSLQPMLYPLRMRHVENKQD